MLDFLRNLLTPDITIALAVVVVAVAVFFAVRIGVLPKKSAPFVAVALLAAIGFSAYRERHARNLHAVLKKKEEELRRKDKELKELQKQYELSDKEAAAAVARRDAETHALAEQILQLRQLHEAEIKRVNEMTPDERRAFVLNLSFD
jgi:Skp family chaperone for outer membrane proteins